MGRKMVNDNTAIIVDSSASLPEGVTGRRGVYVMPMSVIDADGNSMTSGTDITSEQAEARLRDGEELASAGVAPDAMVDAINQAVIDGYGEAIVIAASSRLSPTYATACAIAGELAEEPDKIQLDVVDSRSIGAAEGLVAMEALALLEDGFEFDRIAGRMTGAVAQTRVWFAAKSPDWLRRGRHVDGLSYRMGSLIDMYPLLTCDDSGRCVTAKRVRGWKKVVPAMTVIAAGFAGEFHNVRLAVCATTSLADEAKALADDMRKRLDDADIVIDDVLDVEFPPELLVHTGPDAIGIAVQGTTL